MANIAAPARIRHADLHLGSWHISLTRDAVPASQLAAQYDRAAASWDRSLSRTGTLGAYDSLFMRILPDLDLPAGAPVLDCGTGTGALTRSLARLAFAPLSHHATDLSLGMCARAAQAFGADGLPVQTACADICHLPYADDSFALTMAAHVCEHLADPRRALSELRRVTRPGGAVLLIQTRRSLAGRLIQLAWRTHLTTDHDLPTALIEAGFAQAHTIPLRGRRARALSVACLATA